MKELVDEQQKILESAQIFLNSGHPEWALEELTQITERELYTDGYYFLKAQALFDLAKLEDALSVTQSGLKRWPESIPLLYLLCNCETEFGRFARAELAILAAINHLPEEPGLLARYGLLLLQAGDINKARRLIRLAHYYDDSNSAVIRAKVILAYIEGNTKDTEKNIATILADDPEDTFGHYMLVQSHLEHGKLKEGSRAIDQAAEFLPANEDIEPLLRENRVISHWSLAPLIWLEGIPNIRVTLWLGSVILIYSLNAMGLTTFAFTYAIIYLLFCIYSWITPPFLRWLLK